MIIGLSGKKGSGKTTVAEYLKKNIEESHVVAFADPLKEMVSKLFGVPMFQLNGTQERKNIMGPTGRTGRELMQAAGCSMRAIWPQCWVNAWRDEVNELYGQCGVVPVIVPDVRFMNEVNTIKMMGGIVVRLTRCPVGGDLHESETALDGKNVFDAVVDNALLTEDETNVEILRMCREWGIM